MNREDWKFSHFAIPASEPTTFPVGSITETEVDEVLFPFDQVEFCVTMRKFPFSSSSIEY